MFTVAAMWSRPTLRALRTSSPKLARGLARRSSNTSEACETVTSSKTPRPPMMMAASSRPRMDSPPTWKLALCASSLARPVRAVAATNPAVRAAVRPRARAVPTTAAVVFRLKPWDRYSEASMIAMAPTSATSTGLWPGRMAGTMKPMITANDTARPISDRIPCQPPKATTATTNSAASARIGRVRSRSWM